MSSVNPDSFSRRQTEIIKEYNFDSDFKNNHEEIISKVNSFILDKLVDVIKEYKEFLLRSSHGPLVPERPISTGDSFMIQRSMADTLDAKVTFYFYSNSISEISETITGFALETIDPFKQWLNENSNYEKYNQARSISEKIGTLAKESSTKLVPHIRELNKKENTFIIQTTFVQTVDKDHHLSIEIKSRGNN
ncbi:MAG: hypothetical protein AAGG81_05770 [Chlamydiota bacterium]